MDLMKSYFTLQKHDIIWSMSLTHEINNISGTLKIFFNKLWDRKFDKEPSIKYIHKIFWITNISNPLIGTCPCEYQGLEMLVFQKIAYVLNEWPLTSSIMLVFFDYFYQGTSKHTNIMCTVFPLISAPDAY